MFLFVKVYDVAGQSDLRTINNSYFTLMALDYRNNEERIWSGIDFWIDFQRSVCEEMLLECEIDPNDRRGPLDRWHDWPAGMSGI